MEDTKLKSLWSERGFLIALLMSLPGLVSLAVVTWEAIKAGQPIDSAALNATLAASPVGLYVIARQYPRGKAVEAAAPMLHAMPAPVQPGAALHDIDEADLAEARSALDPDAALAEGSTDE